MSTVNLYKQLINIKNKKYKDISSVSSAELSVNDNTIELKANGTPSNILINYTGIGSFSRLMPINIKTKIGKTAIFINNTFVNDVPELLYNYSGDITIYDCTIMNYDGSLVKAVIKNNQNQELLNLSETNIEDETLILYDEPKVKIQRPFKGGYNKPRLRSTYNNRLDKFKEKTRAEMTSESKKSMEAEQKTKLTPEKPITESSAKPTEEQNRQQGNRNIRYEGGKK